MFHAFEPIAVLFMILAVGYVARRLDVFDDGVTRGMSGLLLKVTLPALIIDSLQRPFSPELLRESGLILLVSIPIYVGSALVALRLNWLPGVQSSELGVFRFSAMFPNTGFMGYPVVLAIFGAEGLFLAAIYNLPFNLVVFTVGVMFMTLGNPQGYRLTWRTFLNPAVVSVAIGFVFFVFSVQLPGPLAEATRSIGAVTTPLAMLIIGATLYNMKFGEVFGNWRVYFVCVLRLLVIPLALFLLFRSLITNPLLLGVAILLNAMPVAVNTVLLAEEYKANSRLASQVVFVSTLLSLFTIPLMVYVIGNWQ